MFSLWQSRSHLDEMEMTEGNEGDDSEDLLAASLGFSTSKDRMLYAPYLAYVGNSWHGEGNKADFMRLFAELVDYFRGAPFRFNIEIKAKSREDMMLTLSKTARIEV